MKTRFLFYAGMVAVLGAVMLSPVTARGETVVLPLQLDYPFLTSLVIQSAFTDPDQTLVLSAPDNPCQRITLSRPELAGENHLLRLDVAVHLKGGALMGANCLFPIEWDGYLVAHLKPELTPGDWQLALDPVDAVLLDKNKRPAGLMGRLWEYFEAPVLARLGNIRIAANAPVDELKLFLRAVVPESEIPRAEALISSLRPGEIAAEPDALKIQLMADIEPGPAESPEPAPAPLTAAEMDAFIEIWETWDAFLIQELMALADMPLAPAERETLLAVLLDARYRFVNALSSESPADPGDFVREEFLDAWEKLSPVFRRHLSGPRSENSWGVLAFFTASDALSALDKLGPVFNIEISRNGLIRLARMLSENKDLLIEYSPAVDPALRKLLGLEPAPEITEPEAGEGLPEPEAPAPAPTSMNSFRFVPWGVLKLITPRECRAANSGAAPTLKELREWLVTREAVDAHIGKVRPLLAAATRKNLGKNPIPEAHRAMFERAVVATAWQESCFRQFIVDKNKLTYLLSYNNSSVGMMQINERVWRGMYDLQHLRWDIAYNAAAGIDILNLYLQKYALPKMPALSGKEALDSDGVAGALYAMYNGGPGAFSAYVKRRSARQFSKIDNHFREKYDWVKNGQWDRLKKCF